jgi:hypothetical protein
MSRILLAAGLCAGVSIATLTLGPRPASAYGHAPWGAVMSIGFDSVETDCSYWTFQECVPHVISGNRGFCEPNPEWNGRIERPDRRPYRHRSQR